MKTVWIGAHPDHYQVGRGWVNIDTIFLHIMAGTLNGTDGWFRASKAERTAMNVLGAQWYKMSQVQKDEYIAQLIREGQVTAGASSAHYGLGYGGERHQYVVEKDTAVHAGIDPAKLKPTWKLYSPRVSNNSRSIGIEHEGKPDAHGNMSVFMPESQIEASSALVAEVAVRYRIPLDRDHIVKHSEVDSVNRKFCPPLDFPIDEIILRARAIAAQGAT